MKVATLILSGSIHIDTDGTNNVSELSRIYQVAREINMKYSFTGAISYLKGQFFLIIEGEQVILDHLQKDKTFEEIYDNIQVIFFTPVTDYFFPKSTLAVNHNMLECSHLLRFTQVFSANLEQLEDKFKNLLQKICLIDLNPTKITSIKSGSEQSPKASSESTSKLSSSEKYQNKQYNSKFENKSFRLLAWPDFTRVDSSPGTIELCAKLLATSKSYKELIAETKFGTEKDIQHLLELFRRMSILNISENNMLTATTGVTAVSANTMTTRTGQKAKHGFYHKMKNFLTKNKK